MKKIPLYYLKQKKKKKRRPKRKTGGSILYKNFCKSNIKNKNQPDLWLHPQKLLDEKDDVDSNIIETIMNKKKFVIKIQPYDKRKFHINNEIKWYRKLNEINNGNFIKYICNFTCNNDNKLIKQSKKTNLFCSSKDKHHFSKVVIIEYINGKDLNDFKIDNLRLFYSIHGQLALAYIDAYFKYGFIYNDYVNDNILVRKTTKKEKIYNILGIYYKIKTQGYEPVFFDFGITNMSPNVFMLERQLRYELLMILTGSSTKPEIVRKVTNINDEINSIYSLNIEEYVKKILKILVKHYPIKN